MSQLPNLPGPIMDRWEWQFDGLCNDLETSIFFHPDGERGGTRRRRAEAAKAICQKCPVLIQCRDHALATREPYGVWGGMSEDERRIYLRTGRL